MAIGLVGTGRGKDAAVVPPAAGESFAVAATPASITGTAARPLEVMPVSAPRGTRLQRTGGNAEHLVNTAEPVLPYRRPQKFQMAGRDAAQLTRGR